MRTFQKVAVKLVKDMKECRGWSVRTRSSLSVVMANVPNPSGHIGQLPVMRRPTPSEWPPKSGGDSW
jgi:hypothetical protein